MMRVSVNDIVRTFDERRFEVCRLIRSEGIIEAIELGCSSSVLLDPTKEPIFVERAFSPMKLSRIRTVPRTVHHFEFEDEA